MPRLLYGGNIQLDFRNFDFGLVIQGVGKQNSRLSGLMVEPIYENWGSVPQILDGNYWSTYNTLAENETVSYPRLTRNSRSNNYTMSDFWLINGAYFRLKNISLGYTLPTTLAERLGMQNIRVYGNVTDLLTLDNYPKGWDPEVSTTGYPITSSFLMGVSVQF